MRHVFSDFVRDLRGNFTMTFGVVLILTATMVVLAVEYSGVEE
jgi:Flp pilus assembly protein TadG